MRKLIGVLMFFTLMALAGCSQYSLVNSTVYNDANLSAYHTFRIITPEEGKLPPGMTLVTYYNIAAAIREQMVERGFVEDPTSNVLINLALTVKKEIATEPLLPPGAPPAGWVPGPNPWAPGPFYNGVGPFYMYPPTYYPPSYYANAQVITGIYREGVLTMDIVNIAEKIPLYSSSVSTILDNGDTQFRDLQGIAQAVKVLFSKFPVPLLPQYK